MINDLQHVELNENGRPMTGRAYYFGCWGDRGHQHFTPDNRRPRDELHLHPWGLAVDGKLCPNPTSRGQYPARAQIEGEALVHHKDGWTALAFWDRSIDARHGSCSVYVFEGLYTGQQAIGLAKATFPEVWQRYRFDVTVVEPNAPPKLYPAAMP